MSDELIAGDGTVEDSAPICPWCSTPLPNDTEERCPACHAALRESETAEVPGLTRVDHEALLRSRAPAQPARGLIGWLSGEYQPKAPPEPPGTFAPPANEVRREMLRLELAALEAEVHARQAEAAALEAAALAAALEAAESEGGPDEADGSPEAMDRATIDADGASDGVTGEEPREG
jgi:hypothetical protein